MYIAPVLNYLMPAAAALALSPARTTAQGTSECSFEGSVTIQVAGIIPTTLPLGSALAKPLAFFRDSVGDTGPICAVNLLNGLVDIDLAKNSSAPPISRVLVNGEEISVPNPLASEIDIAVDTPWYDISIIPIHSSVGPDYCESLEACKVQGTVTIGSSNNQLNARDDNSGGIDIRGNFNIFKLGILQMPIARILIDMK